MTVEVSQEVSPLRRADGSASYTANGYSVICGVNGPVEVQRRDELPEEAAVDVTIRPAAGVGGMFPCHSQGERQLISLLGVRERHLESILHSTLRQVILVSAHPRTLIQITLQMVASQEDETSMMGLPQAASNIDVLPALIQTAMLALLTTSIPLVMTVTAALICIDEDGAILSNPGAKALSLADSVHILAFSSLGKLVLAQSEGSFSISDWENVHSRARQICLGTDPAQDLGEDVSMASGQEESLQEKLRNAVERRVSKEQAWKT